MKAIILLSVFAVAFASECGVNQHYASCGSACPITCENYKNPPNFCVLMCNPGCHCDEGFVKTKDGRCVKPESCPAQVTCGKNARYFECGSACPLTCDNYNNPPQICPFVCIPGCQCENGFVKTKDGQCVKPESCPSKSKTCAPNEVYTGCVNPCNDCQTRNIPCNFLVCNKGCDCRPGYTRNEQRICIPENQCLLGPGGSSKVCSLLADAGFCRGYFQRYYYNEKTRRCQIFIYGGCGGNGNNFKTLQECQKTCGPS